MPAGILSQRFRRRSPPWYLATAACGGLRSAHDCRPRRAPFITRTVGRRRYADDASVSHDPQRSWSTRAYCDATIASAVRKLILWSRHSRRLLRRTKLMEVDGVVDALLDVHESAGQC